MSPCCCPRQSHQRKKGKKVADELLLSTSAFYCTLYTQLLQGFAAQSFIILILFSIRYCSQALLLPGGARSIAFNTHPLSPLRDTPR